jgi:hypothetical protein
MSVQSHLVEFGPMQGKPEHDFLAAMGPPHSVDSMPDQARMLYWRSGNFRLQRIAVPFDAQGKFVQVTYRHNV